MKTLKALRFSVASLVRRVCYDMDVGRGTEKQKLFPCKHPVAAMVVRSELDEYCLRQAQEVGAVFRIVPRLIKVLERPSHVEVITGDGALKAQFVVGADGANSAVRELTSAFSAVERGFALAGQVAWDSEAMPRMEIDFGIADEGYGWVFPKDDHVNVGVFTGSADAVVTRNDVCKYVRAKLGTDHISWLGGRHLGMGGRNYLPRKGRILLVGDAAGLVDPLLGEGIHNAVRSGQMAARAIVESLRQGSAAAQTYAAQLRTLQRDLLSCRRSASWFYRWPRLGYAALTSPWTRKALMEGFAMGLTFRDTKRYSWLLPCLKVRSLGDRLPNRD